MLNKFNFRKISHILLSLFGSSFGVLHRFPLYYILFLLLHIKDAYVEILRINTLSCLMSQDEVIINALL